MNNKDTLGNPTVRQSWGILIGLGLVLIGIISNMVIRQTGGAALLAFLLVVFFNIAGAVVLDASKRSMGRVTGAMLLLVGLMALPLLWVPDGPEYLRQNPLTFGAMLLIAGYLPNLSKRPWVLYLLAFLLGLMHIVISLNLME